MSWLWSSSKGPAPNTTSPPQTESNSEPQPSPSATTSSQPSSTTHSSHTSTAPAPTRDELADAEWQELVQQFSPASPTATSTSTSTTTNSPTPPISSASSSTIHPRALYPTTLSCRAAFDAAFYCSSLGGQFVNVYRYGGARSCSDAWGDFWFCMRTMHGGVPDEERAERVARHLWERETGRYAGQPSSEDVWRMREHALRGQFKGDYEALEREGRMGTGMGEKGGG